MTSRKSTKGGWFAVLFALPFAGVGTLVVGWAIHDVWTSLEMRSWDSVTAELSGGGVNYHTGDDSTTYQAFATYSYVYNNQRFTGDRVAVASGSDNIGRFQQNLGSRLKTAYERGESITIFVNPESPSDSVIDPSIRWSLTLFKSLFGLVFAAVGYGFLYAILVYRRHEPLAASPASINVADVETPWLSNPDWRPDGILSNAKLGARFSIIFAIFWNLIAWVPLVVMGGDLDSPREAPIWVYFAVGLFPLIGLFLAYSAFRQWRGWQRYSIAPLVLDPFPGSIGGDVGGTIALKTPYAPTDHYKVTLTALRVGRDSDGDKKEKLLWQDSMAAIISAAPNGSRLAFRIPIPTDLPESGSTDDDGVTWRLNLSGQSRQGAIDRDYEIPVFATVESSAALDDMDLRRSDKLAAEQAMSVVKQLAEFSFDHRGQRVFFPAGRHLGFGAALALFGLIFGGVGYFMWVSGESSFMGGLFCFFGILGCSSAVYMVGNSLRVGRRGGDIVTVRRLLGLPIKRRQIALTDIKAIETASNMSSTSGSKHTVYYHIDAQTTDGRSIRMGEGFVGLDQARAAVRLLGESLGLPRRLWSSFEE